MTYSLFGTVKYRIINFINLCYLLRNVSHQIFSVFISNKIKRRWGDTPLALHSDRSSLHFIAVGHRLESENSISECSDWAPYRLVASLTQFPVNTNTQAHKPSSAIVAHAINNHM
jgi:hypothetical protein